MKKHYLTLIVMLALATVASAQTPPSKQLRDIISTGKLDDFFTVSNTLVGVYVPPRYKNVVFAKDKNNNTSVSRSTPSDEQVAADVVYDKVGEFSQSNWVKIYFPEGYDASAYEGKEIKAGTLTGQFHIANTPAGPVGLFVDVDVEVNGSKVAYPQIGPDNTYHYNTYCTCNFVHQPEWFFVKPKNLELANIRWAVYAGDGKFIVPKSEAGVNSANLPGSFTVDMIMWEEQTDGNTVTADDVFKPHYLYEFPALIEFSTGNNVSLNIDPGFDGDINYAPRRAEADGYDYGNEGTLPEGYHAYVFPLRLTSEVITGVEQVRTGAAVQSVRYVDVQGHVAAEPRPGVNICVTTYSDGTVLTEKLLF
ncbi:MAG: hypothetical protein J6I72_08005 [Muribaculaceae bacterium]|nr:hypothetical protein [Muribaculaceae bacterium]